MLTCSVFFTVDYHLQHSPTKYAEFANFLEQIGSGIQWYESLDKYPVSVAKKLPADSRAA